MSLVRLVLWRASAVWYPLNPLVWKQQGLISPFCRKWHSNCFLTSLISEVANDQIRVKTDFKYFSKKQKEKWDPNFLVSWSTHLHWWIKAMWVWNLVWRLRLLEHLSSHNSCGMWRSEFSWKHWYFMVNNGFFKALSFQIAMESGFCGSECVYEPASQWTYCNGANLSWHSCQQF